MFREAFDGGYFSYNMATDSKTDLSFLVRYWGAEWGNHRFDIYIDDVKIATEDNTSKWNQSKFFDIKYAIPGDILKDKNSVRVKFQALDNGSAGPVYYLRLMKN